ncbi:hypothetical protein D9757_004800 [Collybiopsis confluens]|uniref:C2H2-type domain-containing protein n=1 Tax=Collybiopsis confluens TaxID=2823264 RepID=A0A8H5HSM8_9AGAR|nr:hypothetical protein D9757_004800 [Collybiopsis confluens]
MPTPRYPRMPLTVEYLRYCKRFETLSNVYNLPKPKLSMEGWYKSVLQYPGTDLGGVEYWLLPAEFYLPPHADFQLVHPHADRPSAQGLYKCIYPDCNTPPYKSAQYRNNHFDKIHLGIRFPCQVCGRMFMNPGSVTKHQKENRCPGQEKTTSSAYTHY